jgi:hypothetical protein
LEEVAVLRNGEPSPPAQPGLVDSVVEASGFGTVIDLRQVTVAANRFGDALFVTPAPGVGQSQLSVFNSIIDQAFDGTPVFSQPPFAARCVIAHEQLSFGGVGSFIVSGVNPGLATNGDADPALLPGSIAVDFCPDSPSTGLLFDMDGDPRPIGFGFDVGADELNPPPGDSGHVEPLDIIFRDGFESGTTLGWSQSVGE